jgi:hypothetical protein
LIKIPTIVIPLRREIMRAIGIILALKDEADQFFPASGKGFTCNTEKETNGFECHNECPDSATAV